MPNWCSNTIDLYASDEKLDEFEKFLTEKEGKEWFDFFLPCPQELKDGGPVGFSAEPDENAKALTEKYGAADWYTWSVDNWGTKWNCDVHDWYRDGGKISFSFDSAWAPPTKLYEKITEDGYFEVDAHYWEEGMCFVGRFSDGFDDYYEYSDLESLEDIPEEIVEMWNLQERLEEDLENEEDD
jgi:hypothetical protein